MSSQCTPRVRSLFAWEIQEAQRVFGNVLFYDQVRIHECAKWPNTINQIGTWLRRIPYTGVDNAITLGHHCYFPVRLLEGFLPPEHPEFKKLPWLIHELAHVWQYQQTGWIYLTKALSAQFRFGAKAYDYGGEQVLIQSHQQGMRFTQFNSEQQGDIVRDYYWRLVKGLDLSAWQPYISELQQ